MNTRITKALRNYANHAPLDLKSPRDIQQDLLAISGDRHYHKASIGSDACSLCGLDLRNEIHLRSEESR